MKRGSRTDEILTLAFMLLAIGAGVFYFAAAPNRLPFFCIGGAAVAVRIAQYVLRCF
jgi:1,4-dihydroxy-2-naphthoate octaprenyltransferase